MIEHKVTMKSEDPIHIRQFRIPLEHRQTIYDWVDELLKKGAIEVSRSCFNSPIFLVPKPHGHGMRAVLDFREVNAASVPDRYAIREVRDCVDEIGLARSSVFSTLILLHDITHPLQCLVKELDISGPLLPWVCLLYTSPSPRDRQKSRMPSSA